MRKKCLFLSLLSLFSLTSCQLVDAFKDLINGGDNKSEEQAPAETDNDQKEESGDKDPPPDPRKVGEFYGGITINEHYHGYEFSKSTEVISRPSSGIGTINIYSFNDFHGAVLETDNEAGLKLTANFYKTKSKEENTLIIDQGDTWQGSFESNYQYGAIVQDVFNYAGVSLRTVGNHDFDWGLSKLESTNNRRIGDDYIPTLAGNVYNYTDGQVGKTQQSKYGREYATFILDNGVKVGVIGVIGESQITTICSQLVSTVAFTDHIEKIKELSDFLRTEKECDIIIASAHEGSADMIEHGLADISPTTHKRYTDLVLGGHKHYKQEYTENGVKFVQWASNGASTGMISLKYNFETNQLVDDQTSVETYYPNYLRAYYSEIDPEIEEMVDSYVATTSPKAEEVLSENFVGNFDDDNLARLMTEAIFDRVSETVDIDFSVCNYARSSFEGTTFTYGDLYRCFPFDNQIILMDVSSYYGINNIKWNHGYSGDEHPTISTGNTYKCAIVDYIALHVDENRQYDKFFDANNGYEVFNDGEGNPPVYRDILYSYLKKNPDKVFDASNYTENSDHFVG